MLKRFTWAVIPALLLALLAPESGAMAAGTSVVDSDGDGIADDFDNCTFVTNPGQKDADQDGYGNICDADLNNSGLVTTADFGLLRSVLGQYASSGPLAAAADLDGLGLVTSTDFGILRSSLDRPPGPSGQYARGAAWASRLATAPHIFTIDQIQTNQLLAGQGQEITIARFPLVICSQTYVTPGPVRAHLDAVRARNLRVVLIAYQIAFEDQLPPATGPGYDIMMRLRNIESAYVHDTAGNRLYVTDANGTRAFFDPRSGDVRAALVDAIAAIMAPGNVDGIFLDDYGVMNAMLLDPSGKQFTGASGQTISTADYASKLQAMTTLSETIRSRWPVALIIANSANSFPAFNGELVEGTAQHYRVAAQAAPVPGRVLPFMPLYQDTPVSDPTNLLIATHLAELASLGGWYGVALDNQHIMWPPAFGP